MLKDKVIVITGASRGIGEAIARACIEQGARVALASRKQADLDQVASSLPADRAIAIACHTGKPGEVDAMFDRAIDRFGRVDGLVNNAATNPYFGPLIDTPDAAIDKTFEVNVKGYLYCARALVKHVRARGGGAAVVNIASIAGIRAALMQGIYGATKAAVISMTQTLAAELGSSQIRVRRDQVRLGAREQPGDPRARREPDPARAPRPAARARRRGGVPPVRRRVVHDGHDAGRRRRRDLDLTRRRPCPGALQSRPAAGTRAPGKLRQTRPRRSTARPTGSPGTPRTHESPTGR